MNRNKRKWLIALGLLALGLCIATWKLTEPLPPRFAFLVGAEQQYIRALRTPEPVCTISYYVRGSAKDVRRRAEPEVQGWKRSNSSMDSVEYEKGEERLVIVGYDFGEMGKPITHVMVDRPATSGDFVRAVFDEMNRLLRF